MFASPLKFDRGQWLHLLAVVVIIGVAAVLRFTDYGSPNGHSDEQITVEVLRHMRQSGDWDVNWAKANLPPDLRYDQYNFSSHLYATYFFYRVAKLVPGVEGWRNERGGFLVYRFFGALLATIAVLQTWLLGRRVGGTIVGLGAAAIAAVAVLLVQDARYIRPEPFTTVLMLAAVILALPNGALRPVRLLSAALCVGLLVACKVSMLMLVWLPFVPLLFAWRETARPILLLLALPIALAAGFAAGAASALAHPAAFLHGVRHLLTQYAGLHPPFSHIDGSAVADLQLHYFTATLGWPAVVFFITGTIFLLRRHRWSEAALLAGTVILFGGYFASRSVFFERNLSHIIPLLAIVAAFGAVQIAMRLTAMTLWDGATARCLLATLFFVPVIAQSASLSHRLVFLEYSGIAGARHRAFEADVRARLPHAEWRPVLLLTDEALTEMAAQFRAPRAPVLLHVTDYRDEWTARTLALMLQRFETREMAVTHGTFPELPLCTLLTYHSATERIYLVTGLRK